jgi:hypothetical protein
MARIVSCGNCPVSNRRLPRRFPAVRALSRTQISTLTFLWLSNPHASLGRAASAFVLAGLCTFRCVSAVFDQLGTQWRLCTQTDASDGTHGSLAVFLQIVGEAISEPVAFALRVVAEDDDTVSRMRIIAIADW